jgi:hypothetical protein
MGKSCCRGAGAFEVITEGDFGTKRKGPEFIRPFYTLLHSLILLKNKQKANTFP